MSLVYIKKLFQSHDDTQDTNTFKIFQVPIGDSKCVENYKFHNNDPMLKYGQKFFNCYSFSSLELSFASIEQTKVNNAIALRIEKSLENKMGNRIDFVNAILKNEK